MASLNLTLRQRKLLHTIQNRSGMVTGQDLASILNASARTIRSDVVTINHELEPYHARIESIRSKGYYFNAEDPEKIREINRIETAVFNLESKEVESTRIGEIVKEQTGLRADQIKIIESAS